MKKKIAIIGAGPAGYTLAQELLKYDNYEIAIFDKEKKLGGAIYTGIPEYRMSKSFLDKIYQDLVSKGVIFHFNYLINQVEFNRLRVLYDRVIVAVGAQIENILDFKTGNGVYAGLTLLYELNIENKDVEYKKYHRALVWGGGNVAMDCARSLIRLIDDVTIIYRRTIEEMPANKIEIQDAQKEGVKFLFLNNIKDIKRNEKGDFIGAQVIDMQLAQKDTSGRASVKEVAGSEHFIEADLFIMAIGQKVDLKSLSDQLTIADGYKTNLENVYICGDARTGPKTIGSAVLEARNLAKIIASSF